MISIFYEKDTGKIRSVVKSTAKKMKLSQKYRQDGLAVAYTNESEFDNTWDTIRAESNQVIEHDGQPLFNQSSPIQISSGYQKSILYVSSWNVSCGIAEYTKTLVSHLKDRYSISVLPNTMLEPIEYNYDIIHIQYEPGIFVSRDLGHYLQHSIKDKLLAMVKAQSNITILTAHYYDKWLQDVLEPYLDCIIIHSPDIPPALKHEYLVQGCPVFPAKDKIELRKKYELPLDAKILSSFGFIMPWKQIAYYFTYLAPLIQSHPNVYLQLLHAKHPQVAELGDKTERSIAEIISYCGIEDRVYTNFGFLSKPEINDRLQASDLGFIPGKADSKGSSASNKEFVSARLPLVLNYCPHFKDMDQGVKFVRSPLVTEFMTTIFDTINDNNELRRLQKEQENLYEKINYNQFALKHQKIYERLLGGYGDETSINRDNNF